MLHFQKVLRALKGNVARQIRILSGIKARPKHPVLAQSIDAALERHTWLCNQMQQFLPAGFDLKDEIACEAGPGDCLATGALILGLGARHVDLVETQPPITNEKQFLLLEKLKNKGFPIDLDILVKGVSTALNPEKATYHMVLMENHIAHEKYALVYSFCVLEHVEDLRGFFTSCFNATKPGGFNSHFIDLGGHGEFEDPVPPLEFQMIPDWLYSMMYPPYSRATRRFVGDYVRAAEAAGFVVEKIHRQRTMDQAYMTSIQPKLRKAAKAISSEELAVVEFALVTRRPK